MCTASVAYSVSGMFSVSIVVAVTVIVAIAIAAWLVREVARRAIDKASPETVASVITALGVLLYSLRSFLPWSSRSSSLGMQIDRSSIGYELLHEDNSRSDREGEKQ